MTFDRRTFLRGTVAALTGALPGGPAFAAPADQGDLPRLAPGPRILDAFPAWLAATHGGALRLAETGPAPGLDALLGGHCEFAHTGVGALARAVAEGRDAVLVLSPVEPHRPGGLFSLGSIRSPQHLAGARIGVPGLTGPSAGATRMILQGFGVTATLVPLGSISATRAALLENRVDAAYLPVEIGLPGRHAHGWTHFEGGPIGVPGGLVTTRRYATREPARVAAAVAAVVTAIGEVRFRQAAVRPRLQTYLNMESEAGLDELHALCTMLFRTAPVPSLFFALDGLRSALVNIHPEARTMQASDLVDPSFVDALVRSGQIERTYRENTGR